MTEQPWYRTARRWGQTNLVEIDPERYDDAWWREYWKRTRVEGVIVNAGGIVAYYPSEFELHHRARGISDDNDLLGRVIASAREEGLAVIARMDSNRVAEDFFRAHPEWIARDIHGEPYRTEDKWVTCINSDYYNDYLLKVLEEITRRYAPDGFADNSWSGLRRGRICYCDTCRTKYRRVSGNDLPEHVDLDDANYRRWVRWNYDRRVEIWQLNNEKTKSVGGEHCIWMGMLRGEPAQAAEQFNDLRRILADAPFAMLDHQFRLPGETFHQNAEAGKLTHELAGWEVIVPESTPMYSLGRPAFRLAAMPKAEAQLWAVNGFAGGIQPWWHHIGSFHEDRRQYDTAPDLFQWHEQNQDVLLDRTPIADIGLVWSFDNHDFFGRDDVGVRTRSPYRGAAESLVRDGLTYLPVHADDIRGAIGRVKVLVLPNVGALSDEQIAAIEEFHAAGGAVVATGETSLYDEDGLPRGDYGLSRLLGVSLAEGEHGDWREADTDFETARSHTYLRLHPSRNAKGGATDFHESSGADRHPALARFDDTDIVAFGGYLRESTAHEGRTVLATMVPRFPIYPPETSWMRATDSTTPAIVVGERTAMVLADIDRLADRDQAPDARTLLAGIVRWAIGGEPRVSATTPGGVAVNAYAQDNRTIVHVTNTLATTTIAARQDRIHPVGPITVRIAKPSPETTVAAAALRVSNSDAAVDDHGGVISITLDAVDAHELVVVDWSA